MRVKGSILIQDERCYINTIRKDFELMSKVLGESDIELSEQLESIRRDLQKSEKPINRIVLYIDDLDRCTRERVVEVLEAVHLLLAFPLFVVIVGVDTRWVSSALAFHFQDFLKLEAELGFDSTSQSEDEDKSNSNEIKEDKKANVFNYLEKIFQISYQVGALTESNKYTLIEDMLVGDIRTDPISVVQGYLGPDPIDQEEIDESDEEGIEDTHIEIPDKDKDELDSAEKEAEKLHIGVDEQNIIKILSPLSGTTPRLLKRYINTYRIIRSALDHTLNDYRAILMLLALSIGNFKAFRSVSKNWIN